MPFNAVRFSASNATVQCHITFTEWARVRQKKPPLKGAGRGISPCGSPVALGAGKSAKCRRKSAVGKVQWENGSGKTINLTKITVSFTPGRTVGDCIGSFPSELCLWCARFHEKVGLYSVKAAKSPGSRRSLSPNCPWVWTTDVR
jgi:hypothetical protein